jgi:hypothetical protein
MAADMQVVSKEGIHFPSREPGMEPRQAPNANAEQSTCFRWMIAV